MEMIKAMKNDIYSVDIKNILVCFLSFKVLLVEIKQLRAVGMPVVVNAIQIIRKLNTIWYIPRPCSPIIFDKKILYINPKPLTIILDIARIIVDNKRFGIFFKKSPPIDNIYSKKVLIIHIIKVS